MTGRHTGLGALVAVLIALPSGVAHAGTPTGGAAIGNPAGGKAPITKGQPTPKRSSNQACRAKQPVHVTLTNARLTDALSSMPDVDFCAGSLRGAPVINVSDARRYQRVQGFGAAMTDSSAWLLMTKLRPATRGIVFQSLFGSSGCV